LIAQKKRQLQIDPPNSEYTISGEKLQQNYYVIANVDLYINLKGISMFCQIGKHSNG